MPNTLGHSTGEFRCGCIFLLVATLGCGLGVSSLPLYTAGVFVPALQDVSGGRARNGPRASWSSC